MVTGLWIKRVREIMRKIRYFDGGQSVFVTLGDCILFFWTVNWLCAGTKRLY